MLASVAWLMTAGDMDSFTVEFGVYGTEDELSHCRTSRLYGEDGRLSSTSLAFEF